MPIKKFSAPQKGVDPYDEYLDFIMNEKKPHILDRFFLGELVYGPIKRGKSALDLHKKRIIELACLARGTFNIYTCDNPKKIELRFQTDGETFLTPEDIRPIIYGYQREVETSALNWYWYTIDGQKGLDHVLWGVKTHWEMTHKEYPGDFNRTFKYRTLGNPLAMETLFVGEIENTRYEGAPFAYGPGGKLLINAIQKTGLDWNTIGITNSEKSFIKKNGKLALIDELTIPSLKTIITLGNKAHENTLAALEHLSDKPKVVQLPHPSYFSRFNAADFGKYAKLIKKEVK